MTAKQKQLRLIEAAIKVAQDLKHRNDERTLRSMLGQRQRKKLTHRQEEYLKVLLERNSAATAADRAAAKAEWLVEWKADTALQAKARVISAYYAKTGYYNNTALPLQNWFAVSDGNFKGLGVFGDFEPTTEPAKDYAARWADGRLPSKKAITKMIENKYAQKIWDSYSAAPLWAVGDMVTLRSTLKGSSPSGFTDKGNSVWRASRGMDSLPVYSETSFMVIAVDSKPIDKALAYTKAGGTRYYKLLPVGMATPVDVLECDIKRLTKKQIS